MIRAFLEDDRESPGALASGILELVARRDNEEAEAAARMPCGVLL